VLAAIHNASEAARTTTEEKMGPISGGMGGLGGSLGLPGF
jgi:nucleoid-associated protein EbfC